MPQPRSKRQRAFTKRSRTGCRTCRVRHVKCDESPTACRNCTSNGWVCDGYEVNRLPRPTELVKSRASLPRAPVESGFRWAITPDEKRCVSFFLHRTIPSFTSYYDSSLWQKLVLQMCYSEPAVYHAVVALSAINQDLEKHGIPIPGCESRSTWHGFALEQCSRSFGLLSKRHILQDPQLREVLLVCCLLFVMLELVCGRFDDATAHLQSGLAILEELRNQRLLHGLPLVPVEESLLEAFLHLESQAMHHGLVPAPLQLEGFGDEAHDFQTLRDVQQVLNPITDVGFAFLARCWDATDLEILERYAELYTEQQQILSALHRFGLDFDRFRKQFHHKQTEKERRGADTAYLTSLNMELACKTALCSKSCPLPASFTDEYVKLLSVTLEAMDKLQERPLMTIESAICPALFTIAACCPDYSVRWRALEALWAWPHCEGYLNSRLIAEVATEQMKREMRCVWTEMEMMGSSPPQGLLFETQQGVTSVWIEGAWLSLEPSQDLVRSLGTVASAPSWACVKASGILC
ncbi:C6 zinc finger domain protein [Aspergillus carlsbadensis]|nr:C6 zinc finger domain protein [Aspergillus carlsbadensis]